MEEMKPILIKPMVKKYYDKLKTNEQRLEFLENLLFRGMDGQEPQIEDEIVELALMPCLDSIRECRDNYKQRCEKNDKYGILGKNMENWEADQEREKPKKNTMRGKGLKMNLLSQRKRVKTANGQRCSMKSRKTKT